MGIFLIGFANLYSG